MSSESMKKDATDLWEWTVRIQFDKHELGCSFSVCIFLGDIPDDPEEWQMANTFIGAHHAFVSGGRGGGTYRLRSSTGSTLDEGFVHLNAGIVKHSGLNSLDPEVVRPYLKDKLLWKVQKRDLEPAELQSLEVVVYATPLTLRPGEMFPSSRRPTSLQRHYLWEAWRKSASIESIF